MKKYILIIFISLFVVTGCGDNNKDKDEEKIVEGKVTCSSEKQIEEGVKASVSYEISYKNERAIKLVSSEIISSDDNEYLVSAKKEIDDTYLIYKDLDYYSHVTVIDNNTLISTVNIDYEKIDLNKLVEIDDANKNIISNDKVSVNALVDMYESLGNVCNKK